MPMAIRFFAFRWRRERRKMVSFGNFRSSGPRGPRQPTTEKEALLMKHALALGLVAAAAALPAHAGTIYVPYATDEAVGSARDRTEIVVTNPGDQPARVRTLFVAADGASRPGRTTTVAAHGTAV